jgi:hypothetical protein
MGDLEYTQRFQKQREHKKAELAILFSGPTEKITSLLGAFVRNSFKHCAPNVKIEAEKCTFLEIPQELEKSVIQIE